MPKLPARVRIPVLLILTGVLGLVVLPGTLALQNATVVNTGAPTNTAATKALYFPTAAAGVASGHAQSLTWTLPAPNNGNGFGIMALKQAAGTTCPTTLVSYEPAPANWVNSVASATAAFTDPAASIYAYDANYEGGIACYLIHSGFKVGAPAPGWAAMPGSTGNPGWESLQTGALANAPATAIAQTVIGFVVTNVASGNGGVAGKLDQGDTFAFDFNQPVSLASVNLVGTTVCAASGTLKVNMGDTGAAGTNCVAAPVLGSLAAQVGSTHVFGLRDRWPITSAVWSNANKHLVVTLGAGLADTMTGNWKFTPKAGILSANGAPAANICITAAPPNGLCIVTKAVGV